MTPTEIENLRLRALLAELLRRDEAHVNLLAAYRSGWLRTPEKAIDTLNETREIPGAVRAVLAGTTP